jgi:hypothetical protein
VHPPAEASPPEGLDFHENKKGTKRLFVKPKFGATATKPGRTTFCDAGVLGQTNWRDLRGVRIAVVPVLPLQIQTVCFALAIAPSTAAFASSRLALRWL